MNMAGGSFWAAFGVRFANTASTIDSILNRASFTIEDLLDEDDVIQECKFGNNSLIDYLSQPDVLEKLIQFVIMTPESNGHPSDQDKSSSKYPYMASELFACENLTILDALFSEPRLLKLLFSFLDNKPPLNPSCSGYFRKVVVVLIQKKYLQLVSFLKTQPDFVTRMVDHVGLYSIMELLIMIGWDDGLGQVSDFPWLYQENVVPKLVAKLDPAYDPYPEVQCNAARALVDVVVKCPVGQNNVLVSHLLSPSVLEVIFRHMFSGSASSLTNALSVVTVLVQRTSTARDEGANSTGDHNASADSSNATTPTAAGADHSDSDNESEEKKKETPAAPSSELKTDKPNEEALPPLISMLLEHLPKLAALLVSPPMQKPAQPPTHRSTASARLARRRFDSTVDQTEPEPEATGADDAEVERDPHGNPIPAPSAVSEPQPVVIRTQFGELKPPLGETRIKAVELFLVLCASNYTRVNAELVKLQVLPRTLDLFFSYPWNNMLHTLVENIVHTVLLSDTSLRQALFEDARLIDRLIDSQEQNQKVGHHYTTRENGAILHFYRAGYMGHVIRICDTLAQNREPALAKYLGEYPRWVKFISPSGGLSVELNVQRTQIGGPRPGSQIEEELNPYMTHETDSGGGMGMGLGLGLIPMGSLTKDDDHDNDGSDSDDHDSDEPVFSKGYGQDGKDDSNEYGQKSIQISELIHNFAAEYDEEDYHRSMRAEVDENDIEADVHNGNGSNPESAGPTVRRGRHEDDDDEDGDGDQEDSDPMDQMASRAIVEHGDHDHEDSDDHDDAEHGHHPARRRPSFEEDEEASRANQVQGRAQVANNGNDDDDEDDVVYSAPSTEEALPAPVNAAPVNKSGGQSQQGSAAASAHS